MKARKRRVGRPPGRKAPHRPVLSMRIPQEDYAMITQAAATSGRTVSEEAVWRVRESFAWQRAHADAQSVLREANRVAAETVKTALAAELRRADWQHIRGMSGSIWVESGTNLFEFLPGRELLEQLLERAAIRAIEKAGRTL